MPEAAAVAALVRDYRDDSDGAAMKSRELVLLLLERTPAPFSRQQFTPGHVTGTGLVLAPDGERILLVHHRRLDRWLLPGGHVEPEDATAGDAARREVIEETGAVLTDHGQPALIGIDVHGIPPRKSEPYHLHHDLMFSFQATSEHFQVSSESREVLWCAPAEFGQYEIPGNIRRAYERRISGII